MTDLNLIIALVTLLAAVLALIPPGLAVLRTRRERSRTQAKLSAPHPPHDAADELSNRDDDGPAAPLPNVEN